MLRVGVFRKVYNFLISLIYDGKGSFRIVFGNAPIVKVIDFFLDNREFDYSLTDIAKNANIGWSTLHQFWKDLVKLGIVTKTRRIGRAELYKLNISSPLVQKLIDIDTSISQKLIDKEMAKTEMEVVM